MTDRLVAEALPRTERLRLVAQLHQQGCADQQIGEALAYSTYTAARIRAGLGLAPNRRKDGHADPQHQARVLAK